MGLRLQLLFPQNRAEAVRELQRIGVDRAGVKLMASKALFRVVKVSGLPSPAANILKQHMLSLGGEAAVNRGVVNCSVQESDVILMGTSKQYRRLANILRAQPWGLKELADRLVGLIDCLDAGRPTFTLRCRGKEITLGERTLVMGILNLTPDSFSDGGRFMEREAAIDRAHQMVDEGADIIDVGAESTRPGSEPISAAEELKRLMPVLEVLVEQIPCPLSVDTYKSEVAEEAAKCGAHILNDIWGLKYDPELARVAGEYGLPLILMHNQRGTAYGDLMGEVIASLSNSIATAVERGVPRENIIVDPGIGFGKDTNQNLEVLRRLGELRVLGCPILLGTSRKSVIGNVLGLPVNERMEGTAATVALGISAGANIVRVHDVKEMVRVARMTDAILRAVAG